MLRAVILLVVSAGAAFAQGSGVIFGNVVDSFGAAIGQDHADVLGPVAVYNDRSRASKVARFFDTNASALPAIGTFGTGGRNILYGPGLANLDAGIFKEIRVDEQRRFEIRCFNSLNRPNFLNPNSSYQSTAFGRLTWRIRPASCNRRRNSISEAGGRG